MFYDCPSECAALLREIHDNFDAHLSDRPPTTHESLTQVGYTGFRWATQIEPFWNAYYLALVIYLANQIEDKRIPTDDRVIFSYRYQWSEDEHKLFGDSTWNDYRKRCVELSRETGFVVLTDIADFYPRIYHHRLENELDRLLGLLSARLFSGYWDPHGLHGRAGKNKQTPEKGALFLDQQPRWRRFIGESWGVSSCILSRSTRI